MGANRDISEVTNSTKNKLKNMENEGERENPTTTISMEIDSDESGSNAVLKPATVSALSLDKEGYAIGASSSSLWKIRPPAPFLIKIYDMVENPETDSIISWSSSGTSFTVWNHHKFAAEVLGKYFRHDNFATFTCQLNTYGFKKINWDRLEYQNPWFQKGKRGWLKKIKRRLRGQSASLPIKPLETEGHLSLSGEQKKLECLIHEHDALELEMMKLKEIGGDFVKEIKALETQAQCITSKQQKILKFVINEVLNRKKELQRSDAAKKRNSDEQQSIESLVELLDEGETSHRIRERPHSTRSDMEKTFMSVGSSTGIQKEDNHTVPLGKFSGFYNADYSMLEKQLKDDENCENVPGGIAGNGVFRLPSEKALEKMEYAKGLRGTLPPFLLKTFQMVEDTETNNIISWNPEGTSLIILDHLKLAADVLPNYFKHNNFSSFIYQLNNYGFRKIGLRQYEYKNRWFRRGQKHMLVNVKKRKDEVIEIRKQGGPRKQQKTAKRATTVAELENFEDQSACLLRPLQTEEQLSLLEEQNKLACLMHEYDGLKLEMMKLKEMEGNLVKEMKALEKQVQCVTSKQQNILKYMIHEVLNRKKELQSSDAANEKGSGGQQSIESFVDILDEEEASLRSQENPPSMRSGTGNASTNVGFRTAVQEEDFTDSFTKASDFYSKGLAKRARS